MSEPTKACSLTEEEVKALIHYHARETIDNHDYSIDRMNYLNRRLKSFGEIEIVKETPQPEEQKKDSW